MEMRGSGDEPKSRLNEERGKQPGGSNLDFSDEDPVVGLERRIAALLAHGPGQRYEDQAELSELRLALGLVGPDVRPAPPDEETNPEGMIAAGLASEITSVERHTRYDLDQRLPDGVAPRECLERFDPTRAGLPDMTPKEVDHYLDEMQSSRPWLRPALDSPPEVRRLYAALDRGQGHALLRHEGFGDDEMQRRRVLFREDPAQLDAVKREAGLDGIIAGEWHRCGGMATRIRDPQAFATALARGVEHGGVRSALTHPFQEGRRPSRVRVPLEDLLGPDGGLHCSGYRLAGDDSTIAAQKRDQWAVARSGNGNLSGLQPPEAIPIRSFKGGMVEFRFRANRTATGYEINTMFVWPPAEQSADPQEKST